MNVTIFLKCLDKSADGTSPMTMCSRPAKRMVAGGAAGPKDST
eukprot:CAMPEP_0198527630 /NCGR_PEP_ID=MMETSP1462-20131121/24661_1 /TAXON_ID=1333877 /ORGANISM="Brandtodinium nutriculum, Strain RCC3387" /LENGTH=42 /DNA_ID= /DNA_START= /DNA_END= /DNA_ORIENTATION=